MARALRIEPLVLEDVAARAERHRRAPTVRMPILPMRPALPNFLKAETHQESGHLAGLQNRQRSHPYATRIL
jgi:hypothetical protein